MHKIALLLGPLILGALGCSDRQGPQPSSTTDATVEQSAAASAPPSASQNQSMEDCVRGEPEALLASGSNFVKSSPGEALETVSDTSGPAIVIRHFGCTSYALEFQLTWPQPQLPAFADSLLEARPALAALPLKDDYQPLMKQILAAFAQLASTSYDVPLSLSETDTLTASQSAPNILVLRYESSL